MTADTRTINDNSIELLIRANQLREMREYQQALKIYINVVRQSAETVDLDQMIAYTYFQLGLNEGDETNYHMALVWINKAIALAPDKSHLYDILGMFHSLGTLNYQGAANAFRKAIELNPNNVHALVSGAALYNVPEEVITLAEAINWLKQAVQIEPNDPNYHLNLAILFKKAGNSLEVKNECLNALMCPRPLDKSIAKTIYNLLDTASP